MNRHEKESTVLQVKQDFASSTAFFIIGVKSLTVHELLRLRTSLRAENAQLQVVKNTLSRRALAEREGFEDIEKHLCNQVALVFAHKDPASVARELCNYATKVDRLSIVAGSLGTRIMNADTVRFLGTLPTRDIVAARLCGALKAPIARHIHLLKQVLIRFVLVLQQIQKNGEHVTSE